MTETTEETAPLDFEGMVCSNRLSPTAGATVDAL